MLALQLDHISLVISNLTQQLAVGVLLIQKFIDQLHSVTHSSPCLDVLEGYLDSIEFQHLPAHLVSQQFLDEFGTEVDLIPIFLFGIFVLKRILSDLLHLTPSEF